MSIESTEQLDAHAPSALSMTSETAVVPVRRTTDSDHQRTKGEKIFDLATYGGLGTLGNEAASFMIMKQAESGAPKRAFEKFIGMFTRYEHAPDYISKGRFPVLFVATLGGHLMVPPIKWLENRKGAIVRKLDCAISGEEALQTPEMQQSHQEIDAAPQQSWGSLGKARVITVVAAALADFTFGWRESLSAKFFHHAADHLKDSPFASAAATAARFSSLDHVADEVSHAIVKRMDVVDKTPQGSAFKNVHNATWLVTLSTTLTLLFYATSKMLAKDTKEVAHTEPHTMTDADIPNVQTPSPVVTESPQTTIHAADHQAKLEKPQALQLG